MHACMHMFTCTYAHIYPYTQSMLACMHMFTCTFMCNICKSNAWPAQI